MFDSSEAYLLQVAGIHKLKNYSGTPYNQKTIWFKVSEAYIYELQKVSWYTIQSENCLIQGITSRCYYLKVLLKVKHTSWKSLLSEIP